MKSKVTNAYISALEDLQKIHALYNPGELSLFPTQIAHDFEGDIICAINRLYGTACTPIHVEGSVCFTIKKV